MRKKLITKLLVATILSMTISTGIAYAKTDTKIHAYLPGSSGSEQAVLPE